MDRAQALSERLLKRDLDRQRHVLTAERRLKGTPHCCGCGEEIPAARRAAVPSACFCIECQEERE